MYRTQMHIEADFMSIELPKPWSKFMITNIVDVKVATHWN